MSKVTNYIKNLISSESTASSKRFVTLIMTAHFLISAFTVLFLVCYLIVTVPKGTVNKDLTDLLKEILQNDMFVILSGLGFIGVENWVSLQVEKAKAIAGANILTGNPTADVINVDMGKSPPETVPDVDNETTTK